MDHRVVGGRAAHTGHPFGTVPITGRHGPAPSDTIGCAFPVPVRRGTAARPRSRTGR